MAEPPKSTTHHHQNQWQLHVIGVRRVTAVWVWWHPTGILHVSGGTLLGSYMFHDMIPWDDDMDLWISYRDVPEVTKLFRNETLRQTLQICSCGPFSVSYEYGYQTMSKFPNNGPIGLYYRVQPNDTHTVSEHFFKLFYTHSKTKKWRWPFIDIAIYDEDGAQVKFNEQCLMFPWNVFYHLVRRPLGPNMLLAPHDTRVVLQGKKSSLPMCFNSLVTSPGGWSL